MARSRAGLALALLSTLAILVLLPPARRRERLLVGGIGAAGLIVTAVFAVEFAIERFGERLDIDPLEDARLAFGPATSRLAWDAFPWGTGLGSFVPVYASSEGTNDLIVAFANRAHNDALELLLELGAVGLVAMLMAVGWLAVRSRALWQGRLVGADAGDLVLARAGAVIIAVAFLHSLVDYPLRTTAMMVTLAFCAGLLVPASQSDAKSLHGKLRPN